VQRKPKNRPVSKTIPAAMRFAHPAGKEAEIFSSIRYEKMYYRESEDAAKYLTL